MTNYTLAANTGYFSLTGDTTTLDLLTIKATQVVLQSIESYSTPVLETRATQVLKQVIETYSTPVMEVRSTQIVLQVLRSVDYPAPGRNFSPIYLTNCDTDVTYPGGPTWSSRTVRVDADKTNRPLAHWKRGLDVDQWVLTLAPRTTDPVSGTAFPDTIANTPWIEAARGGALDGCEIEIFRAYFPTWSTYTPTITPTGIVSIFAGRVAEVDVTDSLVILTLNDFRELLTTMLPKQTYSAQCRHTLFDYGCKLQRGAYLQNGTATSASTKSSIVASADMSGGLGAGQTYNLGNLQFTSGYNAGLSRSITGWSSPSTFGLLNPFPFDVIVGDTFVVSPGCNKTQDSCNSFSNIVNFGGEPYIPTVAAAM